MSFSPEAFTEISISRNSQNYEWYVIHSQRRAIYGVALFNAEAIYKARDAIAFWRISKQEDGCVIPEPTTRKPDCVSEELVSWVDVGPRTI